ncbi:uncharacterized protein LOC143286541 [Babylonia areolata]|uniref:uncharacterized protein LOC143286541 n=1 Tax=Babylonia areolata TaxID=304850 RepID=UPI003FD3B2BF
MAPADIAAGKPSSWFTMEITGSIRYLCPEIFHFRHITALVLSGNLLVELPPDVAQLVHLTFLDVSNNKLCSIPGELGDLTEMRELLLNNNQLRTLPFELGKLFQLFNLELKNNPLSMEFMQIYHSVNGMNGTQNLLSYMLEHLPCE